MKNFTQNFLAPGLLALSLVTASGAAMADPCTSCGVVTGTHTEEYKGKATALGTVGGAVVGGILGNQVGKGDGNTIATIAGAVGGAYAGREIEKRQRKHTVWITTVQMNGGGKRTFTTDYDPKWSNGSKVEVNSQGELVKRFSPTPKPTPKAKKAKKQNHGHSGHQEHRGHKD